MRRLKDEAQSTERQKTTARSRCSPGCFFAYSVLCQRAVNGYPVLLLGKGPCSLILISGYLKFTFVGGAAADATATRLSWLCLAAPFSPAKSRPTPLALVAHHVARCGNPWATLMRTCTFKMTLVSSCVCPWRWPSAFVCVFFSSHGCPAPSCLFACALLLSALCFLVLLVLFSGARVTARRSAVVAARLDTACRAGTCPLTI